MTHRPEPGATLTSRFRPGPARQNPDPDTAQQFVLRIRKLHLLGDSSEAKRARDEEARTGPNEKEEGHLSAKGDVCLFHRNRAGYGVTTGMTQRRHRSLRASTISCCLVDKPRPLPAWACLDFFFPPTHPAVVNRTGHWHAGCCVGFSVGCCAPGGDVTT